MHYKGYLRACPDTKKIHLKAHKYKKRRGGGHLGEWVHIMHCIVSFLLLLSCMWERWMHTTLMSVHLFLATFYFPFLHFILCLIPFLGVYEGGRSGGEGSALHVGFLM